jgi:hypothetical protein
LPCGLTSLIDPRRVVYFSISGFLVLLRIVCLLLSFLYVELKTKKSPECLTMLKGKGKNNQTIAEQNWVITKNFIALPHLPEEACSSKLFQIFP